MAGRGGALLGSSQGCLDHVACGGGRREGRGRARCGVLSARPAHWPAPAGPAPPAWEDWLVRRHSCLRHEVARQRSCCLLEGGGKKRLRDAGF
ncbi:hypothetical protein E2C01_097329 [Portunus trituberculatus]|uniref:Uncharacterized protein n=1 Tax=Portunus trituberculatus TaxID=210409 RepID=A0A5B7K5F1_PORTR|nr:hypothetical protein [Portunus trituberculatus]